MDNSQPLRASTLPPVNMRHNSEMLSALFENATEGIIVCDRQGKIALVNPTAEQMFGYKSGELKGNQIEILIPTRYSEAHIKTREASINVPRKMGNGRDLFGKRKDGSEFIAEVSLSPFKTTGGEFIMSFIVDVTERKLNETQLRTAHEKLKQASEELSQLNKELESKVKSRTDELDVAIRRLARSKQEADRALEKEKELNELKSRFITTASHEFRTPLGTILSSVSLISNYEGEANSAKRKKHIERIKSSVNNLTEILNDFLSLEKLEEGVVKCNPAPFDLLELMNDLIYDMKNIAKKGQNITLNYCGENGIILDCHLLRNVLLNLFSNAIKYSPEEKSIRVNVENNSGKIKIDISDNGIGIPEEDQPNIFERFYRAKNSGNIQGTGLGLNIVKKYVDLMNGKITFNSVFNEGTTFTVEIPVEQP